MESDNRVMLKLVVVRGRREEGVVEKGKKANEIKK